MRDPEYGEFMLRLVALEERVIGLDKARALQAEEYARRLDELNHAHAQALEDRGEFVLRAVYELHCKERANWEAKIENELAVSRGRMLGWAAAIGAVIIIVQIFLHIMPLIK